MGENRQIILFGAGQTGKRAIHYYGTKNVRFFADNYRAGQYHCGIPVLSVEELKKIHADYEIIIAVQPEYHDEIKEQLEKAGIQGAHRYNPYYEKEMFVTNPQLLKFKNIHAGKRCFVIGNGPSLRAEDLDKIALRGDISFASNRIYKIYEKTIWRPDYLFATDRGILSRDGNEIVSQEDGVIFIGNNKNYRYELPPGIDETLAQKRENVYCFLGLPLQREIETQAYIPRYQVNNRDYPQFTTDVDRFSYEGMTVTYSMLQWAAYMGFKEIYMLGVDSSWTRTVNAFTTPLEQRVLEVSGGDTEHFCSDYIRDGDSMLMPDVDMIARAYEKAEQYSREHGFRIYNAGRGGKVEAFERVDFDELMR